MCVHIYIYIYIYIYTVSHMNVLFFVVAKKRPHKFVRIENIVSQSHMDFFSMKDSSDLIQICMYTYGRHVC
jgi:hypothetical protein